jgi:hypothetical protein
MRRFGWQVILAVSLVLGSSILYLGHYAIFREPHDIYVFVSEHIAYIPVEVLLVTVVMHRLLTAFERRRREERGLEKVRFKGHTIISGWNENLGSIMENLISSQSNPEIVLVNSKAPEDMNQFRLKYKSGKISFVHGDFTSETILELANAPQADTIIVVTDTAQGDISGADQRAILATLAARRLSSNARI